MSRFSKFLLTRKAGRRFVSDVELGLGSIAKTLGVLAIAVCGLLMLSRRIDVRRGMTVVLGCFIVFGAPVIASGLRSIGISENQVKIRPAPAAPIVVAPIPAIPTRPPVYDPYAGANVVR